MLLLALLAGTTTAFALTEALKLEKSPVSRPRFKAVFSPTCACPQETARLAVRLRDADTIDAVIVDDGGNPVRTLVSRERYAPGRTVFRWDGRDDRGEIVPDGTYRLRLNFAEADRTILIPDTVRVDTRPPAIELVRIMWPRLRSRKWGREARMERAAPRTLVSIIDFQCSTLSSRKPRLAPKPALAK